MTKPPKKEEIKVNWPEKLLEWRKSEPIVTINKVASEIRSGVDKTVLSEFNSYFVYGKETRHKDRHIRGPADYEYILDAANDIHRFKDRAGEWVLWYKVYRRRLYELFNNGQSFLSLKSEVLDLKNEKQRDAVFRQAMPDVTIALADVEEVLSAAESVIENLNMTYYILASQAKVLDSIMYKRNLVPNNNSNFS